MYSVLYQQLLDQDRVFGALRMITQMSVDNGHDSLSDGQKKALVRGVDAHYVEEFCERGHPILEHEMLDTYDSGCAACNNTWAKMQNE